MHHAHRAWLFLVPGILAGSSALAAAPAGNAAHVLNGTWDTGGGIDFLQPQKAADGSLCVSGCAPAPRPAAAAGAPAAAPAPRPPPNRPKYKPEFEAKVADLTKRQVETDSVLRCHAPGVPRIGPPDQIVQGPKETVFLYEDVSGQFFRVITTDGRPHRKDLPATPLGDAVGHWDGETFVVVTRNLSDDTWLTDNGAFHTTDAVVTERIRIDGDTMTWDATVDDPKVLAEPWKVRARKAARAQDGLPEEVPCIEQDLKHVVDGTHHDNPR